MIDEAWLRSVVSEVPGDDPDDEFEVVQAFRRVVRSMAREFARGRVDVAINGRTLRTLTWDDRDEVRLDLNVPSSLLKAQGNALTLSVPKRPLPWKPGEMTVDVVMFNWIELDFPIRGDLDAGPFPFVAATVHLGWRLPQRHVAAVTTNVPGPRTTLYALGRELEEILPYVPIADRVRTGVAIFSYRDDLTFGITADRSVTDLDLLVDAVAESVGELLAEAQSR